MLTLEEVRDSINLKRDQGSLNPERSERVFAFHRGTIKDLTLGEVIYRSESPQKYHGHFHSNDKAKHPRLFKNS